MTAPPGELADPGRRDRLGVLRLVGRVFAGRGAERFMAALITNLPRERFEVTVTTTRFAGGRVPELLEEGGVPHVGLDRRGRCDVAQFHRLTRFLRRQRIDVVHAHTFGSRELEGVPAETTVALPVPRAPGRHSCAIPPGAARVAIAPRALPDTRSATSRGSSPISTNVSRPPAGILTISSPRARRTRLDRRTR